MTGCLALRMLLDTCLLLRMGRWLHSWALQSIFMMLQYLKWIQQKPIVHKHSQCVEAMYHRVELLQYRCVGVTYTPGDLDVPSPLHAAISCGQPSWISSRRRCRSPTLSSCNELVHRFSKIGEFIFQSLVKTSMFMSNPLRVYDIFSIGDEFPFISCTS